MKNRNLIFNLTYKVILAAVFFVFCLFNVFQNIDFRLYDSLIKFRKQPAKNENVMLVKVDDPSIIRLGEWPWSRDIYADALIRMKELGAYNAMFDIEYISPSKNGIAPSAEKKINNSISDTESNLNELLIQLTNAIQQGYYSLTDLPELTQQLLDENIGPSFQNLVDYVDNNMSRDNDEYFAQALQFFGKSYLTINHEDLGFDITDDEIKYITRRILLNNVTDKNYLINIGNEFTTEESEETPGFIPALYKLITRAYGANFTNSIVDNDGVRRRMELLYAYNNRYITQLAFGPYLEIVKSNEIIRQKDELIIKNATDPVTGIIEDIKIPLDQHGRLLINYLKGSCDESFKNDSIINLINLDLIEEQIVLCLGNLSQPLITDKNGAMLNYTSNAQELLAIYNEITNFKEYLLSKCTGYDSNGRVLDGISDEEFDQYFGLRNQFYDLIGEYLKEDYLIEALNRLDQLKDYIDGDIIQEYTAYMNEDFDNLKYEYDAYNSFMNEMKPLYNGAYCILGNTATSTTDNGATPYEKKFMNVGIHANLLNTLLTKDYIYNIRWYYGLIAAIILSLLMIFTVNISNTKQNIICSASYLIFAICCISLFLFSHFYLQMIGIMLYLFADLIIGISYRFSVSVKEKRFITQIAASFANKDTVEELRKNPAAFKTEGQKKCITALFSDIQKFSTLSESINKRYGDEGPNKLIEILNEYLGQMSNEILRNSGNIDKYEGDAIISMFGAPDPMNSHTKEEWAYLCLDSAIRMKQVEVDFNRTHEDLFKTVEIINKDGITEQIKLNPLQTRIGVNSGDAYVGLMGSKTESFSKLNYTMIGDTVNLASRLEGVNKAYNSWIMCSDSTWNLANYGAHKGEITARKLDRVRVVGRSTPVQLYNVLGFTKDLPKDMSEQIEIFNAALDKYRARDFTNAGKLFIQANSIGNGDPTALIFAERCKNFIQNGVPDNWDGVINMTSK